VVVVLLCAVFALTVLAVSVLTPGTELLVPDRGNVSTLLSTLLSGIILHLSIVVSVASLLVSHELSRLGRQRERIEEAREFCEQTEALLDRGVSPASSRTTS
jgi:hypothetical protein